MSQASRIRLARVLACTAEVTPAFHKMASQAILVSEKFCNWIIMRRSVNLRSE